MHTNSLPPSYPFSKVSLLNQLLHSCCYWSAVWKSAYANGLQRGQMKVDGGRASPSLRLQTERDLNFRGNFRGNFREDAGEKTQKQTVIDDRRREEH